MKNHFISTFILLFSLWIASAACYASPFRKRSNENFEEKKYEENTAAVRSILQAPGDADPVPEGNPSTCVIPFHRAGNLILIEATADTTHGNFILDTGASGLVLNITYFRNYPTWIASEGGGVTGAVKSSGQTVVDNFSFGTMKYHHVYADLANLGHIEDTRNEKIFGLLGVSLFKHFEMIIDYDKSVIYLHLISRKESTTYASDQLQDVSAYNIFPIDLTENKIIVKGALGGKNLKFIIDTGAESNVLDSRLSNKVFENVSIDRRVTLQGSGDTKVDALYGNLKSLKLQNTSFSNLPVLITNLEQMCISYNYCIDGMLGFDFLSAHKVGFNFVKHEMYIWK